MPSVIQTRSTVSVVVCTFNGGKYVLEQLQSIATQRELPTELIIVDDGSTDATSSIIDKFLKTASCPTKYLRNESTLGVTKNFEKAVRESTGQIVMLADQDDIWEANKLVKLREGLDSSPTALLLFSNASCIDLKDQRLRSTLWKKVGQRRVARLLREKERQFSILLGGDIVTGATVAFRRQLAARALPIPIEWLHDAWFAIFASIKGQIFGIDECLIRYRIHKDQVRGVAGNDIIERALEQRILGKKGDLRKFLILKNRISALLTDAQQLELDAKILHLQVRSSLSSHAAKRAFQVLQESISGRYGRYSSGLPSVALDLLGH